MICFYPINGGLEDFPIGVVDGQGFLNPLNLNGNSAAVYLYTMYRIHPISSQLERRNFKSFPTLLYNVENTINNILSRV